VSEDHEIPVGEDTISVEANHVPRPIVTVQHVGDAIEIRDFVKGDVDDGNENEGNIMEEEDGVSLFEEENIIEDRDVNMEAEPAVDVSFTLDDRATLLDLAREWCLIQIGRNCSNQVSNDYFQFAWANAHVFVELKKQLNGKKITMKDLREKVVNQCAPGIFSDYVFEDLSLPKGERKDNQVFVYNQKCFPRKEYPVENFELVSQITKYSPKNIIDLHKKTHRNSHDKSIVLSIDGVSECNSSSRSLEVLSMKFLGCKDIYPCLISRPEVHRKKEMAINFEAYVDNFIAEAEECGLSIKKLVADAPERAHWRKQKAHGGFHSCDVCTANPVTMTIPGRQSCNNNFSLEFYHYTNETLSLYFPLFIFI
jgi:hypothetical protein